MGTELTRPEHRPLTVESVGENLATVQQAMKSLMRRDHHFGVIPGTKKPTLLLPGAQLLCVLFRLRPLFTVEDQTVTEEFVRYRVTCSLEPVGGGPVITTGVGSCNSKEKKYRRSSPLDIENTILKMAKKRAHIDATLNATAASDIFTQDMEDMAPRFPPREQQGYQRKDPLRQPVEIEIARLRAVGTDEALAKANQAESDLGRAEAEGHLEGMLAWLRQPLSTDPQPGEIEAE